MENTCYQYILLTGPPGIGKTTLIKKVCKILHEKNHIVMGFFTEEVRQGKERIGFDIVSVDGCKRTPLARIDDSGSTKGPKVGKYLVNVKSIEARCLEPFTVKDKNTILVLDEIGKMELLSRSFKNRVTESFNVSDQVIFGTIPLKSVDPLIEKIKSHPKSLLISVDKANRESLVEVVVTHLIEARASLS